MPLIARLRAYAADAFGILPRNAVSDEEDESLAAIALLVHVSRADGMLAPAESDRLARFVEGRYAASRSEAEALIARAVAIDAQTRDMAMLVERIGHEAGPEERQRLLGMAWSVASADGAVDEFEEALVWRLGGLLGLDEAAIDRARSEAGLASSDAAG
ncbi:MAG TPA: TerB family tellurite resistance protein [Methylobacterium sp.]